MSLNLFKEPSDYREFKQPFELKNVHELQIMTEMEKEMFLVKLKTQIKEYQGKEEAYELKAQELLAVEDKFRYVHSQHHRKIDTEQMSDESYEVVIKGLEH